MEFEIDRITYVVAIKSGPNWGNSSQIKKMKSNFEQAIRILRTNNKSVNARAVNGCCYGRASIVDRGSYLKLCGQSFWAFISGNEDLYLEVIEPIGYKAKERNDSFEKKYSALLNRFTSQFITGFCKPDGSINWEKLVVFNSSTTRSDKKRQERP